MTVLVIAYKRGLDDGVEMKHSLRSIEKNLHMPDLEVVLVGDTPPEWMKPDLHVLSEPSGSLGKASNIARSVWLASKALYVEGVEDFIYLDDDYFLMDPTDSVMSVHGGALSAHLDRCRRHLRPDHWFLDSMKKTHEALFDEMPNLMTFELHRPLPVNVDEARELLEPIQGREIFWRSWYGNMSYAGQKAVEGHDGRYVGKNFPTGVPWVSSEDGAWTQWAGKKLSEMFQEKSRWER